MISNIAMLLNYIFVAKRQGELIVPNPRIRYYAKNKKERLQAYIVIQQFNPLDLIICGDVYLLSVFVNNPEFYCQQQITFLKQVLPMNEELETITKQFILQNYQKTNKLQVNFIEFMVIHGHKHPLRHSLIPLCLVFAVFMDICQCFQRGKKILQQNLMYYISDDIYL